jgi:hypothetical protein
MCSLAIPWDKRIIYLTINFPVYGVSSILKLQLFFQQQLKKFRLLFPPKAIMDTQHSNEDASPPPGGKEVERVIRSCKLAFPVLWGRRREERNNNVLTIAIRLRASVHNAYWYQHKRTALQNLCVSCCLSLWFL